MIFDNIKINNYIIYYIIEEMLILIATLSNFSILYLARIFIPILFKKDDCSGLFENFDTTTTKSSNITSDDQKKSTKDTGKGSSLLTTLINYHKQQYPTTKIGKSNFKKSTQIDSYF